MLFSEFKNYATENIINYLTPDFEGAEISISTVHKANGYSYEALAIRNKGEKCSIFPALDLTRAYEKYQQGEDIEDILSELAAIRMNAKLNNFDKDSILTFDGIKDKILPRLVNTASNAEYLTNKPHIDFEDLSIMFVVRVEATSEGIADAPIDNQLMNLWNVDFETIKASAFENITNQQPVFMSIEKALFEGKMNEDIFDLDNIDPQDDDFPLYILSNKQKVQGASIIFNTPLMEKIAEKLGKFLIIPSSIHEVLITPANTGRDTKELSDLVKRINDEVLSPRDRLSDNVYAFDIEDKTIRIA